MCVSRAAFAITEMRFGVRECVLRGSGPSGAALLTLSKQLEETRTTTRFPCPPKAALPLALALSLTACVGEAEAAAPDTSPALNKARALIFADEFHAGALNRSARSPLHTAASKRASSGPRTKACGPPSGCWATRNGQTRARSTSWNMSASRTGQSLRCTGRAVQARRPSSPSLPLTKAPKRQTGMSLQSHGPRTRCCSKPTGHSLIARREPWSSVTANGGSTPINS